MPQFTLLIGDADARRKFQDLDAFTQGYIEAAFFTDANTSDDGDLENATFSEIADQALDGIIADCSKWQADNAALLNVAYIRDDYDMTQAGRDYWFTRNGHGVGFWDRRQLRDDGLGERLSKACRYHAVSVYRGDNGLIYLD